jgi:uncharacterized protein YndB with AHSA1/START domain
MAQIEVTDVVRHPRDRVFAAAADPEQQLQWDRDTLKSVEKLSSAPLGRGSRYRGTFKGFGTVDYEFAEFDEPNRFAHLARVRVGRMRHSFNFDDVPEGTRVTQVGELQPNLLGRLMGPMFKKMLAKRFRVIAAELDAYLSKAGSSTTQ